MKHVLLLLVLMLALAGTAQAAITGQTVISNLLTTNDTDRVAISTNATLNISFTDSLGNNFTNISLPAGFNFTSLAAGDIESNAASLLLVTSANGTGRDINISYTQVSPSKLYFNITANLKTPSGAGTYNITVATNASTTPVTISLFVRDATKPYYVKANNSNHAVVSETFGTDTTNATLSGSGAANLTFFAPNITTQTNITVGWGATNATIIRSNRTGSQTTIFVEVNPSVSNPIITLSAQNEFEHGNLPAAITAVGLITGLTVVYAYLRRRRRH